jgi:hypothetical protein
VFQTGSVDNYLRANTLDFGMRNRVINGAMVIDQRNSGAAVSAPDANLYTIDRWQAYAISNSKYTVHRDSSANTVAGFTSSLKVTSLAATSSGATDYYGIAQKIEGFNYADLRWGTANARPITLSFWVRSSLTGQFGGAVVNGAGDYSYPFSYTINSANTWEYETITIPGPTAGTWIGATNASAIQLAFNLGYGSTYTGPAGSWSANAYYNSNGSTSVVGTNGATWYVTGVQFEEGSVPTPFEYRDYGQQLSLCQRYCYVLSAANNGNAQFGFNYIFNSTTAFAYITFPILMRGSPNLTTVGTFNVNQTTSGGYTGRSVSAVTTNQMCETGGTIEMAITGGTAGGVGTLAASNNTATRLIFSAEL